MPTKEEAGLLEIATSLPVWEIVRVGTSGRDDQPIEVAEYIVASDRVDGIHVLHRDDSGQQLWPEDGPNIEPGMAHDPVRVEAAGRTHVGRVRQRNEDSLHVGRSLFAVADGLGGHVAGDIASSSVIKALQECDHPIEPGELVGTLGRAVSAANDAVRRRIAAEPEVASLGTTLVAMLWSGTTAVLANVGDSRIYLRRDHGTAAGETRRLTEDHTYQHLVADAPGVAGLPTRLTRFLDGRADGRSPDISTHELRPGDRLLLCSDGLSAVVPHELIHATLERAAGPGETAEQLIDLFEEELGAGDWIR